jgi:GNAT superfamily N-acetyltransferase
VIRSVRYSDLDEVRRIFVSAFNEEYGRRGVDIASQVARWKRMYPLIRALAVFPNPYKYMLNVHVLEEDGQIQGFIQTSPGNAERTRWHIDFVAVAPECQGRGLGVRLVEDVFERYGAAGVKCFTLEVDHLNAPALRLYEKLGFRQYAAVTYYQMEKPPEPRGESPSGLRPFRGRDAQALYELWLATTPAPVRLVDTRKPSDFALGLTEKGIAGLRRRLGHVADERFVVEHEGKVVAYLRVMAQLRALPHTVQLLVHPGYEHLYAPLLDHAARVLQAYPAQMVLAWAPDYQPTKQQAFADWGLQALTVDRCLVRDSLIMLKLPVHGKEGVGLEADKAFKPAFTQQGR